MPGRLCEECAKFLVAIYWRRINQKFLCAKCYDKNEKGNGDNI